MKRLWCRLFHRNDWRPAKYFVLGERELPAVCARCHCIHYAESKGTRP